MSIIIVNYNTVHLILDCIASVIEKTKGIEYEIIVVDNNSCDDAASKLAERFDGRFKYVQLPDNVGFGKANIEGYKHASGRNIFCSTLILSCSIMRFLSCAVILTGMIGLPSVEAIYTIKIFVRGSLIYSSEMF